MSKPSIHTSVVPRALTLFIFLLGGTLLKGDSLGYAVNGTATGFFGGVDISGWYSADWSSSSFTVNGPPGSAYPHVYTFTGPLNGPGYTTASQIPPTPCVLLGCPPGGTNPPGTAGLHVAPTNSVSASLNFEDTGEDFLGIGSLTYGWITNVQGGPSSAPTPLSSSKPVAEITGSITQETQDVYYDFLWRSGAFSVTGSIPDASSDASYLFSVGAAGRCSSEGTATLNSADSFTSTIAIANLPSGEYCLGISASSPNDPAFSLIFNTAVTGSPASSTVPEPSGFVVLSIGFLTIGWRLRRRQRQ